MKKTTLIQNSICPGRKFLRGTGRAAVLVACLLGLAAFSHAQTPANDNFDNPTIVSANIPTTASGSNVNATRQTGDPADVAYIQQNGSVNREPTGTTTVWFRWTPSTSAAVTIATRRRNATGQIIAPDSTFDTQLGVYTGATLGSLQEVASNEDALRPGATAPYNPDGDLNYLQGGRSEVRFNAIGGTTYQIMVSGYRGEVGAIGLHVFPSGGEPPPPPPPTGTNFTLTVNITPNGSGTVVRNPAQPAGGYTNGTVVTLTATPAGDRDFLGWSGAVTGTENPIQVTMTASQTVTATFSGSGVGAGSTLVVEISGEGRVGPNLNGRTLIEGRRYVMTARPARGHIFDGWTGVSSNAANARLVFNFQPDMVITANFVPNPFLPVRGRYEGLVMDADNVTFGSAGCFLLNVTDRGRFSGRLIMGGRVRAFRGQFDSSGAATGAVVGRPAEGITADLQLDMAGDTITGTVRGPGFESPLQGHRAVFNRTNRADDFADTFTWLLTDGGYARVLITPLGQVRIRGRLSDGAVANQNTIISSQGVIPVCARLYGNRGILVGPLQTLVPGAESNNLGTLAWIKLERPRDRIFPEGFQRTVDVLASAFSRPPRGTPTLNIVDGDLVFTGGNFETQTTEVVTLGNNNAFVVSGENANRVRLVVLPTGLVRGNFRDPVTGRNVVLTGAVLTNDNVAGGFFLVPGTGGTFQSGTFEVVQVAEPPGE